MSAEAVSWVIDRVLARAKALCSRLGRSDQQRLDRLPRDPQSGPHGHQVLSRREGARLAMAELAYMAFACDLTRIIALTQTHGMGSELNLKELTGFDGDLHSELGRQKMIQNFVYFDLGYRKNLPLIVTNTRLIVSNQSINRLLSA